MFFLETALSALLSHYVALALRPSQPPAPAPAPQETTEAVSFEASCEQNLRDRCPGTRARKEQEQCLGASWADLDDSCQKAMGRPPESPCAQDAKALCSEIAAGETSGDCLSRNRSKLSASCREDFDLRTKRHPCYPVFSLLCKGPVSSKDRKACLLEHLSELPRNCLRFIRETDFIKPCADDIQRFCGKNRKRSDGDCLAAKMDSLAPACRRFQQRKLEDNPCGPDITRFCDPARLGSEGPDSCLGKNLGRLSPACRNKMRVNSPCRDDSMRFCEDVPVPLRKACLADQGDRLSQECRKALLEGSSQRDRR